MDYYLISQFHVTPDDGVMSRNIYIEWFYCFNFVVPRGSPNKYVHVSVELTPESYNLIALRCIILFGNGQISRIDIMLGLIFYLFKPIHQQTLILSTIIGGEISLRSIKKIHKE